jgi:hypothetical protein
VTKQNFATSINKNRRARYCHTTQQKHNLNTHFNSPETNTSYVEKGQTLPQEPCGTPTEDSPTILAAAKT